MARYTRSRRPRMRTIVKYVKTRARRYAPRKKKMNYALIGLGIAAVAGFVYKDKIKAMMAKP